MNQSPCSDTEVVVRPIRIGAGSFAAVYICQGRVAFKQVHDPKQADLLLSEYRLVTHLFHNYSGKSFFSIPRAYAYCDEEHFTAHETNPKTATTLNSSGMSALQHTFKPFSRATYMMDYIFPLPSTSGDYLSTTYFPPGFDKKPTLCRLYFGKVLATPSRPPRFINTSNFPLDEARYTELLAVDGSLPTADVVARGMGQMLGRLHFLARVDARDIEFVLGGDGLCAHTFYVIDFNQVRPFDGTEASVADLASAFFANDPYYPRPSAASPLYAAFKSAYLEACPADAHGLDVAFIQAIEAQQAQKDAATHSA